EWHGTSYSSVDESEWHLFLRNERVRQKLENTVEFSRFLRDPGTGFTHPRKVDLTLQDLYIYPDLTKDSLKTLKGLLRPAKVIASGEVLNTLAGEQRVLILGGDQAGKTALARVLYCHVQNHGQLVPILLSGADLQSANEDSFLGAIRKAFEAQYPHDLLEVYKRLPLDKKVLIIDDWNKARLSWKGQKAILDISGRLFGRIVVLASDLFRVQEVAGKDLNPFLQ